MRLYAVTLQAERTEGDNRKVVRVQGKAGAVLAVSNEEATGLALKAARIEYPKEEGWRNYQTAVFEVPDDLIMNAAFSLLTQEFSSIKVDKSSEEEQDRRHAGLN